MSQTPKTIQIFLPTGDPQGIRIAEITTRIVQVIEVPRSLLDEFSQMPESDQVALYFLFSDGDQDDLKVYIGQTGDLRTRLKKHNKEKEFWDRVLVVISRTNTLTQTHTLFLESFCLKACRDANRYADDNSNSGTKPHTPPPLEADCLEIFDTARTLLATLGHPLFVPVAKPEVTADEDELFYCKGSGANGRGIYTPEGFVVLKGSTGRKQIVTSFADHSYAGMRDELITNGVCTMEGDQIVFLKDHLFRKPSKASAALQGRAGNGWTEWKNKDGKTLNELKRQSDG